jgi:tetratricopeptide (TPR) repeat protein
LLQTGQLKECEPLLHRALRDFTKVYGTDHVQTLAVQSNYAQLKLKQGHVEGAAELMKECMQTSLRVLGDHPDTCLRLSAYASVLQLTDRLEEAEALRRQEVDVATRLFGPQGSDTLAAVSNLGILLAECGREEEAAPLLEAACEGYRASKGDKHIKTLNSINNYAGVLLQLGEVEEASELYEEALEGLRITAGKDHPDTLFAVHNYAKLLTDTGDLEGAEPLFREVLAAFRKLNHPDTMDSVVTLARLLLQLEQFEEAADLLREAVASLRTQPEQVDDLLECVTDLGTACACSGQSNEAYACFNEILQTRRRLLGEDAPETITAMSSCASVLADGGKPTEALAMFVDAHKRAKRALGPKHEVTRGIAKTMKMLQDDLAGGAEES